MFRIGTRGSPLALWQARRVQHLLAGRGHEAEISIIVTTGDRVLDHAPGLIGGKAIFLREIEDALLEGRVDIAVHSLKDVPVRLPEGLGLSAFLARSDPRDALLSSGEAALGQLPRGARVGTTSLRRRSQLKSLRPDLQVTDLRGNVDTRIGRLHQGHFEAIVLAMAGLLRLGREAEVSEVLDPSLVLPAPGQGVIAVESRSHDGGVAQAVSGLNEPVTERAVRAERSFSEALGAGCNAPLGALAEPVGEALRLRAYIGREDGSACLRAERTGRDPVALGQALAEELLTRGARELMPA